MATQLQANNTSLAPGLHLRAAQWSDLEAVAQLIVDVCTADGDATVALSLEELRSEWQREGFDPARNAWVVETADGRIIGFEEFLDRHAHAVFIGDGYVHPDFTGRGIGSALLQVLDRRARQEMDLAEPDLRVFIRNYMAAGDTVAREIHGAQGYKPVRFSWRMEISLPEAPTVPGWPEGITLRPFRLEEHNQKVFEADAEAFSDHWGITPWTFGDWQIRMTGSEDFDPALWFIAWDGGEIAGYSLCRVKNGLGWVGELGVRRPWRKRGLGMALLLHSFGELYQRGLPTIALLVDASNPTGATRLYQKAGMHAASEFVVYEKEYRSGREIEEG
jgi:mycothiol synthase